ncbi:MULTISPECIES: zinc-binding dehydrogenase [Halorussus]|uniref:zinc-binding dehydrogenase n=1 Tax=Halorussus TaxID=1070314 RepID=UPI0020A0F62B|nr:zinc-binding dehydrogenase [Halorussus vallis]USZ74879.1 zinc-binding dehydrogenase [Halorussus vallis]
MRARALYFTGPGELEVREREVSEPGEGEVRVRAECSMVSPGTELLVYRGEASDDLAADSQLDSLSGSLSFPLRYGYAVVGRVTATGPGVDPSWEDRRVLAFHPHESRFCAPVEELQPVPEDCPSEAAAFLPNVETAVNFLHDGAPVLGERAVVFGQGVVGLLTTALLSRCPLDGLATVDRYDSRRERSATLGADATFEPGEGVADRLREWADGEEAEGADLTYELSGSPAALDAAIDATGYDGRVLVGSWYGSKLAELHLGGRFHRSRVSVESTQVSTVAPERRGRWTKARRLDAAWRRLREIRPERFVTHEFDLGEAEEAYRALDERPEETLGVLLTY